MTDTEKARWDAAARETGARLALARRRRWFRLPEETGIIVALIVMIAVIGLAKPRFLNPINLFTVFGNTTFQGMLSLGMVFLLAIREIDLSVGWMFNFSAVIAALLMVAGLNPWFAMVAGVGFGALLGLVNGLLAISLRLPSIIVTLGTFSMFEGLALVSNNGRAINPPNPTSSLFHSYLGQDIRRRPDRCDRLRIVGCHSSFCVASHALWLPCPGGGEQPGCGAPCRNS